MVVIDLDSVHVGSMKKRVKGIVLRVTLLSVVLWIA
jgi:hypothetical protein